MTLIATALCADRAIAAAPERAQARSESIVSVLASRLAVQLRGNLPQIARPAKLGEQKFANVSQSLATVRSIAESPAIHAIVGNAFAFRLPPPAC